MNQPGVPICFPPSDQTLFTFPASAWTSQLFPYTSSPALPILSNNQSSYADDQVSLPTAGGASSGEEAGDIIKPTTGNRKKPESWTMEEHRNFLSGIELHGKGKWKIIAKQVVKTKTPSQVASHAQKYFIRQNLPPDKRKRSSIHDHTVADDVISTPQKKPHQLLVASPIRHPTPFSPQQPQHAIAPTEHPTPFSEQEPQHEMEPQAPVDSQASPSAPTAQPPAPVESHASPSTSYAPVPTNVDQSDDLLYLPNWGWQSRFG